MQTRCNAASPQQLWQVKVLNGNYVEIANSLSGKCIAIMNRSMLEGRTAIQTACDGTDDQIWEARRAGNTFSLVAKTSDFL